jgi:hypothetical protein
VIRDKRDPLISENTEQAKTGQRYITGRMRVIFLEPVGTLQKIQWMGGWFCRNRAIFSGFFAYLFY